MPQQENGPKVKVQNGLPGMNVRVSQSYRSGDDYWRGMVTLAYQDDDLMDIEGSVKEGRNGLWFAPPSRSYENNQGDTKYKNLVWFHSRDLAGALVQAVKAFKGDDNPQPIDDDDLPM